MSSTRCPTACELVPLLVRKDSTTYRPHASWCRWAPRSRPPVVVLIARPPDVELDDEDDLRRDVLRDEDES